MDVGNPSYEEFKMDLLNVEQDITIKENSNLISETYHFDPDGGDTIIISYARGELRIRQLDGPIGLDQASLGVAAKDQPAAVGPGRIRPLQSEPIGLAGGTPEDPVETAHGHTLGIGELPRNVRGKAIGELVHREIVPRTSEGAAPPCPLGRSALAYSGFSGNGEGAA